MSIFEKFGIGISYFVYSCLAAIWAAALIYGGMQGVSLLDGGYTERLLMNSRDSLWLQGFVILIVLNRLMPWVWGKGQDWRRKRLGL